MWYKNMIKYDKMQIKDDMLCHELSPNKEII